MLKKLMLNKKISEKRSAFEGIEEEFKGIETRSKELEVAIEEAQTEEEMKVVEDAVNEIEGEKTKLQEEQTKLQEEIKALEEELEDLEKLEDPEDEENEKDPEEAPMKRSENKTYFERGNVGMEKKFGFETRSQIVERLEVPEVKAFYEEIRSAIQEKRSLKGSDVTIPTQVVDMVNLYIKKYSKFYDEVTVVSLNGKGRILVDGAVPTATWLECCDALKELELAFTPVEIDCYKVGGFVPVCNAMIEDSMIQLATYVEQRIGQSIAKALDVAIIGGKGSSAKQPEGINNEKSILEKVKVEPNLAKIMASFGLLEINADAETLQDGENVAIMNGKTFFNVISPQMLVPTIGGQYIVQGVNTDEKRLPDGTRVLTSNEVEEGKILYGNMKNYVLGERKGTTIENSTHVQFIQDHTVFKGVARYDGKVARKSFIEITLEAGEVEGK